MEKYKYKLWGGDISFNRELNKVEKLFLCVLSKADTDFYWKVKDRNGIDSYVKEQIEKMVTVIERNNKLNKILSKK